MLLESSFDSEGDTHACNGDEVVPACVPHAGERIHLRVHTDNARLVRRGGGRRVRGYRAPGGWDSEIMRGHVKAVRRYERDEFVVRSPRRLMSMGRVDIEEDVLFLPGDLGVVPNVEAQLAELSIVMVDRLLDGLQILFHLFELRLFFRHLL